MGRITFSVIIPTLNEEKFLPKLLTSLCAQTQKNFEVIVVDGASRDKTVAVARSFTTKLPHLTILESKKASLPLQRNLGAGVATGKWLVFVDADSMLLPDFIARADDFIRTTQTRLFTTWFTPDSDDTKDALVTLFINMFIEGSLLLHRPFAPGPLTAVTAAAYTAVGGYDETIQFAEDYDFTKRLTEHGVVMNIFREALCVYSLRRMRKQGKLKVFQAYAKAALVVLLTRESLRYIPGYIMGGQLYSGPSKRVNRGAIATLRRQLRKIFTMLMQ